ncbi:mRNA-degrading endonuclease [Oceanidesulfovibrio indonesiensis]|uniref:mRNA-degrading endonuclease n=1 Tax=Oceanidesulfovibrio indonesiensis TaxID=54767 RepID=A0A7M3MKV9_9BACT|nr:type II toxin-antitoxin system PemK/MazF family toxin [Oceanidesulfovibrio indonesiensis]TVM19996.1 mRNA-degrading endonuclease [Oceanidesulfovibrio indonesiensis]
MTSIPDRGDFVHLDFNPQAGHEQQGERFALVLSPQKFNQITGFAFAAPITKQQKGYPFEVPIPEGERCYGVVLVDQTRSLDWQARNLVVKGRASEELVNEALARLVPILS